MDKPNVAREYTALSLYRPLFDFRTQFFPVAAKYDQGRE